MKKIVLILVLIFFSIFVLAEDFSNTYCGDGICGGSETKDNCCEDCGDCNTVVGENVVRTVDDKNDEAVGNEATNKGLFGSIINFFKKLFRIDTEKRQPPEDMTSSEPEKTQINEENEPIIIVEEDTNESIEKNMNDEKKIINGFSKEHYCGDGVCDDDLAENEKNCPQDCVHTDKSYCGDGVCNDEPSLSIIETYENCPEDCSSGVMAEMEDKIPEAPEEAKQLNITFFVTPEATCYFDSGASIANYMENISYDKFIWYGRPLNFKYDTRWNSLRTGVGGGELTFESFYNLGYKAYNGKTEKNYPPIPERLHMKASSNFVFFDTNEEALGFIKRLISADIPVMVSLQIGERPDYHIIKGYDKTHIFIPPYVDVMTKEYIHPDQMPLFNQEAFEWQETQVLTYDQFFSLWDETGNNFYWFVKTAERKTEQEIFDINKKDAEEAYDNVQEFIKTADFDSYTSDGDLIITTASASRYLTKKGYTGLGNKYMELATAYNNMRNQIQSINKYSQLAEIYKEAAELW